MFQFDPICASLVVLDQLKRKKVIRNPAMIQHVAKQTKFVLEKTVRNQVLCLQILIPFSSLRNAFARPQSHEVGPTAFHGCLAVPNFGEPIKSPNCNGPFWRAEPVIVSRKKTDTKTNKVTETETYRNQIQNMEHQKAGLTCQMAATTTSATPKPPTMPTATTSNHPQIDTPKLVV